MTRSKPASPPPSPASQRAASRRANNRKFLLVIALACYTIAAISLITPARLLIGGESASGTVVRIDGGLVRQPNGSSVQVNTAVIEFQVDGQVRDLRIPSRPGQDNPLDRGDAVTVRFLRADAASARLWTFWGMAGRAVIFAAVGSVFLVLMSVPETRRPVMAPG
jgi:hypothetical protein